LSGPATIRVQNGARSAPTGAPQKKSGISALQVAIALGVVALVGGGGYIAWTLSSPARSFSNQEQARATPNADRAAEEPAKTPVAVRTAPPKQAAPSPKITPQQPATPQQRTPTPQRSAPAQPQRAAPEIALDNKNFETAQFIGTPEAYALYLRLHPQGQHASKAQRRTR